MNLFQFASENPGISVLIIMLAFFTIGNIGDTVFRCYNRTIRGFNIRRHGWPPPHCDADGDFRPEEKPKEEWVSPED